MQIVSFLLRAQNKERMMNYMRCIHQRSHLLLLWVGVIFALAVTLVFTFNAQAANICVNTGGTNGCYSSIQAAINAASAGDTITVEAGTYNEDITIDKSVTLVSASGAASTIISGTSGNTVITIQADGVTIDGFTIKSGRFAVYANDHSNITIRNNIITDVKGAGVTDNVHAIAIISSVSDVNGISILNNQFNGIGSATKARSASAINIGWTTGTANIDGVLIENNIIANITGSAGAYGVLISHGTQGGQTLNAQVLNNTISNLVGNWAHGIGMEGDTPGAVVQGNTISNLVDVDPVPAPDATCFVFQDNPSAGTVRVKANRCTSAVLGVGNATSAQIDAQYNYWDGLSVLGYPDTTVDTTQPCPDSDCFPKVQNTEPANGAVLTIGPSRIDVGFNENMLADGSVNAADNPGNYILVEAGANGIFDTDGCQAGVAADDVSIAINSVVYSATTRTARLNINGGTPLPPGAYRFFICGTTSVTNTFDIKINYGLLDSRIDFVVRPEPNALPQTGFPMGRVTRLAEQPRERMYASTSLLLEIPSLNINLPIVGVPRSDDSWDVSWLGNSAGWLEGSAFPTWAGNTVLTGHVWNADNTPGAFAHIKKLRYGDQVYIHAFGSTYVYEVRENHWVWGGSNPATVLTHRDRDWVTLLTCEGYNPLTGHYLFRRVVTAVLVEVK